MTEKKKRAIMRLYNENLGRGAVFKSIPVKKLMGAREKRKNRRSLRNLIVSQSWSPAEYALDCHFFVESYCVSFRHWESHGNCRGFYFAKNITQRKETLCQN